MARKTGSHSTITGPKVQDAALRLIAQRGYAAVSMREIAAEVGVQAGALYRYTDDKQSLLFSLMQSHMEELLEQAHAVPAGKDAMASLEGFVRFHVGYHIARPEQVFVAYMELRNLSAQNFVAIEKMRRSYEDLLQDILERGKRQGDFVIEDVRLTTFALIAMLTGVTQWYRDDGRLEAEQVADHYWHLVQRCLGT